MMNKQAQQSAARLLDNTIYDTNGFNKDKAAIIISGYIGDLEDQKEKLQADYAALVTAARKVIEAEDYALYPSYRMRQKTIDAALVELAALLSAPTSPAAGEEPK